MEFNLNHPILFVFVGLIIAAVVGQSVYFLVKSYRRAKEIGMDMTGEPAVPADMDYSGEMISEPIEAPASEPEAGGIGQ